MAEALDIVDLMRAPFVLGGREAAVGIDCWGFVVAVRARLGLRTPDPIAGADDIPAAAERVLAGFATAWTPVAPDQVAPGDVIVLPGAVGARTHAAVYVGGHPPRAAHFSAQGGALVEWARLQRFARGCWRFEGRTA